MKALPCSLTALCTGQASKFFLTSADFLRDLPVHSGPLTGQLLIKGPEGPFGVVGGQDRFQAEDLPLPKAHQHPVQLGANEAAEDQHRLGKGLGRRGDRDSLAQGQLPHGRVQIGVVDPAKAELLHDAEGLEPGGEGGVAGGVKEDGGLGHRERLLSGDRKKGLEKRSLFTGQFCFHILHFHDYMKKHFWVF